MKNIWIERWNTRHNTEFHIDVEAIPGDTVKEKYEAIYIFLHNLWQKRGGHKIETSEAAGCLFQMACSNVFPNMPDGSINFDKDYRIQVPQMNNFWIIPSMKDLVYKMSYGKYTTSILNVWLDNIDL